MGNNCCSNDEAHVIGISNKPVAMSEEVYKEFTHVNYGQLKRDDESIPNSITFGPPVILHEGEDIVASQAMLRNSTQNGNTLQYSQLREPQERKFQAEIESPDRKNRLRVVQEQQEGHFMTEPLANEQRAFPAMELNKNMRTPAPSSSVTNVRPVVGNQELPFYHSTIAPNSVQPQVKSNYLPKIKTGAAFAGPNQTQNGVSKSQIISVNLSGTQQRAEPALNAVIKTLNYA